MTSTAGSVTPVSTLIDVLARDLTLRWPDRVLIGLDHVMLGKRPRSDADRSLRVEVVRGPPTLVARVLGTEGPALTARVQLADHYPESSATGVLIPSCEGASNAERLYALEAQLEQRAPAELVGALRAVRRHGAAGLIAELEIPRSVKEGSWQLRNLGAPAVLEGMLQLGRWGWFTLSGERARLDGVERMRCFRLPRAGELLRLESLLRGAGAELPRFDVLCCTEEGAPLVSMTGLRLVPEGPTRGAVERSVWQRFLEALGARHPRSGANP